MKEAHQHASAPTSICATGSNTPFILLRRRQRGENIFAAHRSHLYQRLVIAGWRHRTVTLLYLGLALAWEGGLPRSCRRWAPCCCGGVSRRQTTLRYVSTGACRLCSPLPMIGYGGGVCRQWIGAIDRSAGLSDTARRGEVVANQCHSCHWLRAREKISSML